MSMVRAIPSIRTRLIKSVYDITLERTLTMLEPYISRKALEYLLIHKEYALTGSSLLAVLTNADWIQTIGDIDLCSNVFAPDLMHIAVVHSAANPVRHKYEQKYPHSNALAGVTTYKGFNAGSVDFQILTVTDIEQYVNGFDFNFCKNYLSNQKIVVKEPLSILKQCTTLKLETYLNTQLKEPNYVLHTYLPSRYLRLTKYVERGFKIKLLRRYYTTPDLVNVLEAEGNNEDLVTICAYWTMFWDDRVDKEGNLILDRYPVWKHGDIPKYYKMNY